MGTSGDHATPANAVSRSLFKKQSHSEAHESDYGIPDQRPGLFRKNSLDEMTVRRTEKPVEGVKPSRPKPDSRDSAQDAKPIVRHRAGIGSYEDPADERQRRRKSKKSGRPGR
jgi:excinuclease ABC subunit B